MFLFLPLLSLFLLLVQSSLYSCESDTHDERPKVLPEPRDQVTPSGERAAPAATATRMNKICVSLTPSHVSSRRGQFVTFECLASVCTGSDAADESDESSEEFIEEFQMRKPLFDWNTQLYHLLTTSGKCDSRGLNCWSQVEINIDNLLDEMGDEKMDELEIECNVADFVPSNRQYKYLFGKARSILKKFDGAPVHERCNTTNECSPNMACLEDSVAPSPSSGYCECIPSESTASLSLVLITDPLYNEQLCLPVSEFNRSCLYTEQCTIADLNLVCQTGDANKPSQLCVCKSDHYWNGNVCIQQTSVNDDWDKTQTYNVWWMLGPMAKDDTSREHPSRMSFLSVVPFFSGLLFLVPLTVVIFALYLMCRMKLTKRSNSTHTSSYHGPCKIEESYYYGEGKAHKNVLPKISEMKILKSHHTKKDDKDELIDNDQLDHRNQV